MIHPLFLNRRDAGRQLAKLLQRYAHARDPLVLGLPRGGVPVAFEVARALNATLDIFMVRKLGVPGHEELAMGAIATGDVIVWNEDVLAEMRVAREHIDAAIERERAELARREHAYRGDRPSPRVEGRTVILVDDGLATGASMRAAARALRAQHPGEVVIAVPVAAAETCHDLRGEADTIVCAAKPDPFYAVGLWYHDFSATTDDEVAGLLAESQAADGGGVTR
jgi:putative phosphoribosyl transferase